MLLLLLLFFELVSVGLQGNSRRGGKSKGGVLIITITVVTTVAIATVVIHFRHTTRDDLI